MSNGIMDVKEKHVIATIDKHEATPIGKMGEWMPYGNTDNDCIIENTIYEIERHEDGTEKLVNPETVTGHVEIQWSIDWDNPKPDYPNAIAHVYSYPGDFLSIGKYVHGKWIDYGSIVEDERLLYGYSRHVLDVYWNEEHKHLDLPTFSIIYPSESPSLGGKDEDIQHHLHRVSWRQAQEKAMSLLFDEYEKIKADKALPGWSSVNLVNVEEQSFPGCIVYSFTYEEKEGRYPALTADVRIKLSPNDMAVRRIGDPAPEWATQELYDREIEERNALTAKFFAANKPTHAELFFTENTSNNPTDDESVLHIGIKRRAE